MSNIAKLEFAALDISGKNYLSWILDAEIHLDAMNLGNTIKEGNVAVTPRSDEVHSTCNCRGTYMHQVPL